MECVWKNLLRHYKPSPPPDGEFVPSFILWSWRRDSNPRPSDYKSDALPTELRQQFRDNCAFAQTNPSDPFRMSGTILKVTTRGTARASNGRAKRLLLRAVHAGGQAPVATSRRLEVEPGPRGRRPSRPAGSGMTGLRHQRFAFGGRPASSSRPCRPSGGAMIWLLTAFHAN